MSELRMPEMEVRLDRVETLLRELKLIIYKSTNQKDQKLPIKDIIGKGGLMSAPTFYKHVKSGRITLLKLGGRSYVDREAFNNAFKVIDLKGEPSNG